MSQKQNQHYDNYFNSVKIENTSASTLIEDIEIQEAKTSLKEFYDTILLFKNKFSYLTNEEIKKIIEDTMSDELEEFTNYFHQTFSNIKKYDKDLLDMLIALSTIGIEIRRFPDTPDSPKIDPKTPPSSPLAQSFSLLEILEEDENEASQMIC
jgi:hypothetical protein